MSENFKEYLTCKSKIGVLCEFNYCDRLHTSPTKITDWALFRERSPT
ncbi:hypothetical protein [Nostoc sphaeroides]|uniref:Uncharacterized protein n=1 Tax=Nostoc sphaeroides CCNUC1 TaxID=2653204 RepID=A0A5P8W4M1_9NOSO|nr:hypothetical protein [Nostoc sphaeroides]QFS47451.1 hypothetical protein GXM_04943 [Nostoc sphaeroides CCNUC1]